MGAAVGVVAVKALGDGSLRVTSSYPLIFVLFGLVGSVGLTLTAWITGSIVAIVVAVVWAFVVGILFLGIARARTVFSSAGIDTRPGPLRTRWSWKDVAAVLIEDRSIFRRGGDHAYVALADGKTRPVDIPSTWLVSPFGDTAEFADKVRALAPADVTVRLLSDGFAFDSRFPESRPVHRERHLDIATWQWVTIGVLAALPLLGLLHFAGLE